MNSRNNVEARYVRRMLSLAFLAPKIEAIAARSQIDLPLLWTAQEEVKHEGV
jgi:hypothetical protein